MSEQYFFMHKLGLGKEVVSLSLVVMEVSQAGGTLEPTRRGREGDTVKPLFLAALNFGI